MRPEVQMELVQAAAPELLNKAAKLVLALKDMSWKSLPRPVQIALGDMISVIVKTTKEIEEQESKDGKVSTG